MSYVTGSEYRRQLQEDRERAEERQRADRAHAHRQRRSASARKAGIASGVSRRSVAKGRRVWQVSEVEVRRRYELDCERFDRFDRPGSRHVSDRGFLTVLAEYRSEYTVFRLKGQGFGTTNGQRAAALASRGRPRCTRTIQRTRRRLARMGLIHYRHVERQGAMVGRRDFLRVRILCSSYVALPLAAGAGGVSPPCSAPATPLAVQIAPPHGGRIHPPATPSGNCSDERPEASKALPYFDMDAARRRARRRYG